LIPGGGILSAPNYASGCTCNYPVFTALALVHMPEVETWASATYTWDGAPVKHVGINLGAPGDYRAEDGTLWLDYPSVGGPSPDIPVTVSPAKPRWLYRHSARMRGGPAPRVTASGAEGVEKLAVTLREPGAAAPGTYTVRLYFAEHAALAPGDRIFKVSLQGRPVIGRLDIAREAGCNVGLMREFHGVLVDDRLTVGLSPVVGRPVLCGIQAVLEDAGQQ